MMENNSNKDRLFKSINKLTNVVIGFIIVLIVLIIVTKNSDKINGLFDNSAKKVTVKPYSKETFDYSSLRKDAGPIFKAISSVTMPEFSADLIQLGKKLYFDKRLSQNNTISCNSCHNLKSYGVDNLPTSPGDTKEFGDRNSPTVLYAALHASQFWDGRAKDVEEQAGMPILNPIEHNIPSQEFLVERLKEIEEYKTLFSAAYPEENNPITYTNLTKAIGSFERQLIPESRFDQWLDGKEDALSEEEKAGLKSFIDNGCVACHNGVAVGGQMFQKFGVYGNYWEYTKSKKQDIGRFAITQNENDKYVFKVPSLRNIEKTHPYFHDGSVEKLEDAVRIMSILQNNKHLGDKEVQNIVAFLKSLTADIDEEYKQMN